MQISETQHHSHQTGSTHFSKQTEAADKTGELSAEDEKKVRKLKERDADVRRHEDAHKAAAGQYAIGGPSFEYATGPDGRQYAVGGEVQIDTSEIPDDPEATIKKAQVIRRAALAPKEPSAQDQRVAAEASRMETKARQELAEEKKEELPFYNNLGQNIQEKQSAFFVDIAI